MSKDFKLKVTFEDKANTPLGNKPVLAQCTNDFAQLVRDAKKIEPLIEHIAHAIIDKTNQDLDQFKVINIKKKSYALANTKKEERIKEKASTECEGRLSDILDVARGSIDLTDHDHIAAICSVLQWAKEYEIELPHGARVLYVSNRFKNPTATGYESFKAQIGVPIPGEPGRWHIFELMIRHAEYEKQIANDKNNRFKADSHQAYNLSRQLLGNVQKGNKTLTSADAAVISRLSLISRNIHISANKKFSLHKIDFVKYEKVRFAEAISAMEEFERKDFEI